MGQVSVFEGNGYCFLKAYQRSLAGRKYFSGARCLSAGTKIPYKRFLQVLQAPRGRIPELRRAGVTFWERDMGDVS